MIDEKAYPVRLRELVKVTREELPDFNPKQQDLKAVILKMALEQPEIVGAAFIAEMLPPLAEKAFEEKRTELGNRERRVYADEVKLRNMQTQLLTERSEIRSREKAVEEKEKRLDELEKEINTVLLDCETPEIRDKVRLYLLFKSTAGNEIETAANKTAYIAGCASILAGAESQAISSMKAPKPFAPQRRY